MIKKILTCKRCELHKTRRKNGVVIGKGSIPASILFIGEAPSKSDELLNQACSGREGKLLDKMILDALIGLLIAPAYNGYIKYYITNIIMCRPVDKKFGESREPKKVEVVNCAYNLMQIYNIVKPKIIIFLGKLTEKYYLKEFHHSFTITRPAWHIKNGGTTSPRYLTDIQILKEALQCVK